MTYRVFCDDSLLFNSRLESLRIFAPEVELEANKTGSFAFTVYPDHPYYARIRRLKSIIKVYQDNYLLFRGRVLDEETGMHNEKRVYCEGELAFLLDTIQRPYDFTGGVSEYLSMLLASHNAQADAEKQFALGNVTATDENDTIVRANSEYVHVWDEINAKLLDILGGFIQVRHENNVNYIDYLADFTLLSPQKIEFGVNLIDIKRLKKGADIATAIIPLGAKIPDAEGQETEARVTIADVNGGVDYITDPEAIAQYGFIVKTAIFDDVTEPENLLAKGRTQLNDFVKAWETIELSAADLAAAGREITSFHIGTQVRAISKPHGIDALFAVTKLTTNLLNPGENKLALGKTIPAFSAAITGVSRAQEQILTQVKQNAQKAAEAVINAEKNMLASIEVSAENIRTAVSESYALKDEAEALVSAVSTEIEQTKNSVEIQFNQFMADIEAVSAGADAEFEEIRKYIRFADGKILLGEAGNELELQISNARISFLQDGAEVAYFSDRKLHVTDAEILHSLQIGGFAFVPRDNGNVSWKKVL